MYIIIHYILSIPRPNPKTPRLQLQSPKPRAWASYLDTGSS